MTKKYVFTEKEIKNAIKVAYLDIIEPGVLFEVKVKKVPIEDWNGTGTVLVAEATEVKVETKEDDT